MIKSLTGVQFIISQIKMKNLINGVIENECLNMLSRISTFIIHPFLVFTSCYVLYDIFF